MIITTDDHINDNLITHRCSILAGLPLGLIRLLDLSAAFLVGYIANLVPVSVYMRHIAHWLPVSQRITHIVVFLVWRCLLGCTPMYSLLRQCGALGPTSPLLYHT